MNLERRRTTKKTLVINTAIHDVLLTARKNYPAVFVDGILLNNVKELTFSNDIEKEKCEVTLTFDEGIRHNAFPYNKFSVLEKLFGPESNGQSVRDVVAQTL